MILSREAYNSFPLGVLGKALAAVKIAPSCDAMVRRLRGIAGLQSGLRLEDFLREMVQVNVVQRWK